MARSRLVNGKGYTSIDIYTKSVRGKHTKCYSVWKDMLSRCYSERYQSKRTTYIGCIVSESWLDFYNFAAWFYSSRSNYTLGYELDKDILGDGKLYSEGTCSFIPKDLNSLLVNTTSSLARNNELPLGVCRGEKQGSFIAWCNNGQGRTINLGTTYCEESSFNLYKQYKETLIKVKAVDYYTQGCIGENVYNALCKLAIKPFI